ncbi:hypothetical protein BH18ACI5_BH18ACI5_13550 [soil metagenome]
MKDSNNSLARFVPHVWAVAAAISAVSAILMVLWLTRRWPLPTNAQWMTQAGSGQRVWKIHVEVYATLGFMLCVIAGRSATSVLLSTVLFGVGAGLVWLSPSNVAAWTIAICGLVGAVGISASGTLSPAGLLRSLRDEAAAATNSRQRWRGISAVCLTALVVEFVYHDVHNAIDRSNDDRKMLKWYAAVRGSDTDGRSPSAPLTIEIFSDIQCPACRELIPEYESLIKSFDATKVS